MSITIEQDEKDFRRASEFSAHAELDRVTLIDATIRKSANIASMSRPFDVSFHYEPGLAAVKSGCANLQIQFEFRATDASPNALEVITLVCTFEASYSMDTDYEAGVDAVDAFHRANAVFNSWPFFREYVQSTVVRMNMPAPPVPLLRLVAKRGVESPDSTPAKRQTKPSLRRRRSVKGASQ